MLTIRRFFTKVHVRVGEQTASVTRIRRMNVSEQKPSSSRELEIKLTDDQRAELIRFIGATRQANFQVDVIFEADLQKQAVAPVSVLVGNAI